MRRLAVLPALLPALGLLDFSAPGRPGPSRAPAGPSPASQCTPAPASAGPAAALGRARRVTGVDALGGRVVHQQAVDQVQQDYQSDRPDPPYLASARVLDTWYDPATGAARTVARSVGFGAGPSVSRSTLGTARATWAVRDTTPAVSAAAPAALLHEPAVEARPLDVVATLDDWGRAPDVRAAGRCVDRDYPRLVLARAGAYGEERLFLDEKTGFPTKLEREMPHYLWGQQRAEYVYQNWARAGALTLPVGAALVRDGAVVVQRAFGATAVVARDSAPAFAVPDTALAMRPEPPRFLQALPPDTVRVGPQAFLLVNPGYTEAVALVRDTVFLFDATQGEARARQDSAWIARLFPGPHPVVVVVTDLAWPHVAGVRFWVARGAAVASHRLSRPFLERVVARRWTRDPDALERRRAAAGPGAARLRFVPVDGARPFAGGSVRLVALDGIASEGAVVAYLAGDQFLWAGDFLQSARRPTLYAAEVADAAARAGLTPARAAAQHLPLTPWAVIARLNERGPDGTGAAGAAPTPPPAAPR